MPSRWEGRGQEEQTQGEGREEEHVWKYSKNSTICVLSSTHTQDITVLWAPKAKGVFLNNPPLSGLAASEVGGWYPWCCRQIENFCLSWWGDKWPGLHACRHVERGLPLARAKIPVWYIHRWVDYTSGHILVMFCFTEHNMKQRGARGLFTHQARYKILLNQC